MAALQTLETHQNRNLPSRHQRRRQRTNRTKNSHYQWMAAELKVKLIVNGTLSILAVFTLLKLIPYQFLQQEKLKEVRTQVQETEKRVGQLREDFSRNFDPHQTKKVMQENSPLIDPNKRRIYWQ